MRKLVLIVHTSLDGFVAGPTGELNDFDASEENLRFVCQLTEHADAALFGRVSHHLLNSYWPLAKDRPNATQGEITFSNWYNSVRKIVISNTMEGTDSNNTTIIADDIAKEIAKIKDQPGKDILIFGSPSVSQLLARLDLIDTYWMFINPIIFGNGIPLFENVQNKIQLKLITTKQFSNGEFALNYIVSRK